MNNFTEQYLKFFQSRPDLFRDGSVDFARELNTKSYYVFGCIEFNKLFEGTPTLKNNGVFDRFRREDLESNLCFQFPKEPKDSSDYIYIHAFYKEYKPEISLEEFLNLNLSDELRKYFIFNIDLWDRFDNGKR